MMKKAVGSLGLFVLVGLCFLYLFQLGTIAGDNLEGPPWHRLKRRPRPGLARASTVLKCEYLNACGGQSYYNHKPPSSSSKNNTACPRYFRSILNDLHPWKAHGISKANVEDAKKTAAFRIIIQDGKLYTDVYYRCIQSRMMFTVWGFLSLLERFPGQVPDVDIMFNCQDRPLLKCESYKFKTPPPLFGYCSTDKHFDIPFPDFSFWGWPELQIPPWEEASARITFASEELEWRLRERHAYWRGNPYTNNIRRTLLTCNSTKDHDTGAYIYSQDWFHVNREESQLENQCDHRYKIYAEGYAWSVSYKYILACGSPVFRIDGDSDGDYQEFFSRGLLPMEHIYPLKRDNLCNSLKDAIDWGNHNMEEAERMASRIQEFVKVDLNMENVYNYMLNLLQEYAKLQKFKPKVPATAKLQCYSKVLCVAEPFQREMLENSLKYKRKHSQAQSCSIVL